MRSENHFFWGNHVVALADVEKEYGFSFIPAAADVRRFGPVFRWSRGNKAVRLPKDGPKPRQSEHHAECNWAESES